MNNTIPILSGIDTPIQRLQTVIFNRMLTVWGIDGTTYQAYGRAYRNKTKDGYRPEVYTGGIDYTPVMYDDTLSALSFFGTTDPETVENSIVTSNVALIFCIDLSKCKPGNQRLDEQAINDVRTLIDRNGNNFKVKGTIRDADHIFNMYSGAWKKDMIDRVTRHPKLCFRIDLTTHFNSTLNFNNC